MQDLLKKAIVENLSPDNDEKRLRQRQILKSHGPRIPESKEQLFIA
jgi:hypothetical protein